MRRLPLIALAVTTAAVAVVPAAAKAPLKASVTSFDLLQVNQEVFRVKPGGSHPLCQAIPLTAIRANVRWSSARAGTKARAVFSVPGHKARTRNFTLTRSSGTRRLEFTPRTERLDDEAFPGGTYKVTLKAGGRSFKPATVELTQSTTTC